MLPYASCVLHVQTRYEKAIVDESEERCKQVVYDMILGAHFNMAIAASGAHWTGQKKAVVAHNYFADR